jgi:hypothetical protein
MAKKKVAIQTTKQIETTTTETKGRRGPARSEKTENMIQVIDEYFKTEMKKGDTCGNHDLVNALVDKGFDVDKTTIPTDVPLNLAPKSKSMMDGKIVREHDDPLKKRPQWVYRKL